MVHFFHSAAVGEKDGSDCGCSWYEDVKHRLIVGVGHHLIRCVVAIKLVQCKYVVV